MLLYFLRTISDAVREPGNRPASRTSPRPGPESLPPGLLALARPHHRVQLHVIPTVTLHVLHVLEVSSVPSSSQLIWLE